MLMSNETMLGNSELTVSRKRDWVLKYIARIFTRTTTSAALIGSNGYTVLTLHNVRENTCCISTMNLLHALLPNIDNRYAQTYSGPSKMVSLYLTR
jgi:hypothetical protein